MAFKEAFNVQPSGKETKLEVNTNVFKEENKLGAEVQAKLTDVQRSLDGMQKTMKKDLNTDELKVANIAIERELEGSIPSSFKKEYDATGSWEAAAQVISTNILSTVNTFIATRLPQVIKDVDAESWTGSVSKSEAEAIFKKLDPTVSEKDRIAMLTAYSGEDHLRHGGNVLRGGIVANRDEAIRKAMGR